MNVAAGLAKNDDLLVLASGWGDPGEFKKPLPIWVCRSADGGVSWTIIKEFPCGPDGHLVPFGDIGMAKDRSLLASAYARNGYMLRSDDDGRTWQQIAVIAENHNEIAPLHIGGGRWLAVARTSDPPYPNATLDLYVSGDDGRSWNLRERVTLHGQHPGHLLLMADGRILLTCGDRRPDHLGVAARISADEGKTWSDPVRVAETPGAKWDEIGYPSSVQRSDGKIITAYYTNEGGYHMGVVIWEPPSSP